jgi:hypothetical protein
VIKKKSIKGGNNYKGIAEKLSTTTKLWPNFQLLNSLSYNSYNSKIVLVLLPMFVKQYNFTRVYRFVKVKYIKQCLENNM